VILLRARIGLRDAWNVLRARFSVGLVMAVLVALVTLSLSGKTSWWPLTAWGIAIAALILFFVGGGLFGVNSLWRPEFLLQTDNGMYLALHYRHGVADRLGHHLELQCIVQDPRGVRYHSTHAYGGGSQWYLLYPGNFAFRDFPPPAPAVRGGIYTVSWYEREVTRASPGKWQLLEVGTFVGIEPTSAQPSS
jgi:hypothetical protein